MARFDFRLQPLLGVKEQIENQKELEYGQAMRQLEEERQTLTRLHTQREEQVEQFRTSLRSVIHPSDIRRYNNVIERLKQRIKEQIKRVEAAEAFAERKRQELVEAMKERKTLESVRERRHEEYVLEEKIIEQKLVDELVSYQYAERNE